MLLKPPPAASVRPAIPTPNRYLTVAFYRFVELPDAAALCRALLDCCNAHRIKGTVVLAAEGINGSICGTPAAVRAVMQWLRADPRLIELAQIAMPCAQLPFQRLKVRLKKEIVTFGVVGLKPDLLTGESVPPPRWNDLIAQPGVVLIDARNDFEVALGSFTGAINPGCAAFSELPQWLDQQCAAGGLLAAKPAVAMFCTGGIRCEKSTAYLRARGFSEVYQLQGGILGYLAAVPAAQSCWQGECFVFDERSAIGYEKPTATEQGR